MTQPTEATPDPMVGEILSVSVAADVLGMHYVTACKMAKAGTLPGLLPRIGRNHRISRQLLLAFERYARRYADAGDALIDSVGRTLVRF